MPAGSLPAGFGLLLDPSVRSFRGGTVLTGGHPGRIMRLTNQGASVLATVTAGVPSTDAGRRLARRLIDAGMAHPRAAEPPGATGETTNDRPSLTVVIPVHNRSELLDRCLTSIEPGTPVVVVDDGSANPASVAEVCRRHGATLVTRTANGGPAAARNDGLVAVDTELVVFLDSDCMAPAGWLAGLTWVFGDPSVGAVAPRIRPIGTAEGTDGRSVRDRFLAARSPLDMGTDESEVGPDRLVRYVPTAALIVRRQALTGEFDRGLRFGEDVDLVWRLLDSGWHVRYHPSVVVEHHEPTSWPALLRRRFHYGTSAGPLARRHPGRLAPVELRPWPTVAACALLAGRPRTAAAVAVASGLLLGHRVRTTGVPRSVAMRWSIQGAGWTVFGIGRAATMLATPALLLALVGGWRSRRAAAALLLIPPAVEWWRRRPALDPVRWAAASIADDVAYGAGVWAGCLRSRTVAPLVPAVRLGRTARR